MDLLKLINEIVPTSSPEWERVQDKHFENYDKKERMTESLKRKFQHMVCKKVPTSDPNCPQHICFAKRVYQKTICATDGSTGGSNIAGDDLFTNGENSEYDLDPEDDEMGEGKQKHYPYQHPFDKCQY